MVSHVSKTLPNGTSWGLKFLCGLAVSISCPNAFGAGDGFLERCRAEFENLFAKKPSQLAAAPVAHKSPDQSILLQDVRQALKEKNLQRNLDLLKAERVALRPKLDLLLEKNRAVWTLARELDALRAAKPPASREQIESLLVKKQEAESVVKSMSDVAQADRAMSERWHKLLDECPSGRCVAPRVREALIQAAGIDLSPKSSIAYRTPSLVAKIENAEAVPSAFIITHQVFDFTTDATLKMLREDPRFKDMPRVVLGGDEYKVNSEALYREATVVKFSSRGEFPKGLDVNASEYHFAGGFCEWCMRSSIEEVTNSARKNYRGGIKLVFHSDQMFWSETETLKARIATAMEAVDKQGYASGAAAEAAKKQAVFKLIERLGDFSASGMRMTSSPNDPVLLIEAATQRGGSVSIRIER